MASYTLSPPIELTWLGWRTNTFLMEQYGWSWLIEQNEYEMTFIIFAKHDRDNLKAISDPIHAHAMESLCRGANGCLKESYQHKIGPVEIRIAQVVETTRTVVFTPVSMRPWTVEEEAVINNDSIEFFSIDHFFVTQRWIRDQISEENRKKITLRPETMRRRLDII